MRDLMAELKELRLHGMATAWAELTVQGESNTASSKWLLEHLLEQEHTDRAMRSVSHAHSAHLTLLFLRPVQCRQCGGYVNAVVF